MNDDRATLAKRSLAAIVIGAVIAGVALGAMLAGDRGNASDHFTSAGLFLGLGLGVVIAAALNHRAAITGGPGIGLGKPLALAALVLSLPVLLLLGPTGRTTCTAGGVFSFVPGQDTIQPTPEIVCRTTPFYRTAAFWLLVAWVVAAAAYVVQARRARAPREQVPLDAV